MAKVVALQCARCGAQYPPDRYAEDCPACRPSARSNFEVVYESELRTHRPKPNGAAGSGLWRYGDLLPVNQTVSILLDGRTVTLGYQAARYVYLEVSEG